MLMQHTRHPLRQTVLRSYVHRISYEHSFLAARCLPEGSISFFNIGRVATTPMCRFLVDFALLDLGIS